MKRSAFTLIELIFVIVIIGVLAAVAIPQYKNLKQNAEVKALIKTTVDTASSAASAAVNQADLEDANISSDINLSTLVNVKGRGWSYANGATGGLGTYTYTDPANNTAVATIDFNGSGRTVTYTIDCNKFADATSITKCQDATDTNSTTSVNETLTF